MACYLALDVTAKRHPSRTGRLGFSMESVFHYSAGYKHPFKASVRPDINSSITLLNWLQSEMVLFKLLPKVQICFITHGTIQID